MVRRYGFLWQIYKCTNSSVYAPPLNRLWYLYIWVRCMCAKSLQLCLTLCSQMDCGLSGSSVQEILQARIVEAVAMPSSRESAWLRDQIHISCIPALTGRFFTTSNTWYLHTRCLPSKVQATCHTSKQLELYSRFQYPH